MPLIAPFETSTGITSVRRILIIRAFDRSGAFGYGECTAAEDPFFSEETIDTAWLIITKFAKDLARIRGNRMAIGGIEAAIWDLEAKLANVPLWKLLGGTQQTIRCGVSIGLQSSTEALIEKVERELESGYHRIKIKISPGRDIALVEAVRKRFPSITLSVDANSAYTLENFPRELDRYNLLMIEQPLAAGDLVDHSKLQRELKTALCLDESIVDLRSARHALELGSCRIINIKLGRVGGHREARAIQQLGVPVWCGGMLESGVGRAHNIAMSTLPGFTLPGDVSASKRYWTEDIIDPPVVVSKDGTIEAPAGAGIGYAVNEARVEKLTVRREVVAL